MRNLLDNLEEAGMNFDDVVATNIYLDELSDMRAFDDVYAQYFSHVMPARTTIEQIAPAERKPDNEDHYPDLEQVSLIAIQKAACGKRSAVQKIVEKLRLHLVLLGEA
jgi:enamine deaminase RidA (YjgF/YER057c/UK114 family)